MRPAEHCLLKEVLWGAHMGSSTAVTNKKMFVALFWVNYEAYETNPAPWPYVVFDQKWSYPAYPAKWPAIFSRLDLESL